MPQLLVIKEYLQKFYQNYSFIINIIVQFVVGFLVFFVVNSVIGYNPYLNNRYVEIIFGIINVIFPTQVILLFTSSVIVLHVLYVSRYLAFVLAIIFMVLYFLYIRYLPEHGYVILALPILFALKIPYVMPVLLGLISSPVAIVPMGFGVVIYHLIVDVVSVISTSTDDAINLYHLVVQQLYADKQMYASIIIFSVVLVVVYGIRRRMADYSFEIAILAGTFLNTIFYLISNFILDINMNLLEFVVGIVASLVIVWLIQFFRLSLNYQDIENLQFEDDEYLYYVRAVPKNNISTASKRVKRFNAHPFSEKVTYLDGEDVQRLQDAISGENTEESENEEEFNHDFDFKVSLDSDDIEEIKKNN